MITIQDRAAIFDNLAKLVKSEQSSALYADTAQVLRVMEAGYTDLFSAALLALKDGDTSALRDHVDKCEKAAAKMAAQDQGRFYRADGTSGNGRICEHCAHMWVDHVAPNSLCPNVTKPENQ